MNTTVTYQGTDYDVVIEGSDVVLQSIHQDIVIEGGYDQLKNEAINKCKFPTQGEDGLEWDWNPDSVEEEVRMNLIGFANYYACDGSVICHNVN